MLLNPNSSSLNSELPTELTKSNHTRDTYTGNTQTQYGAQAGCGRAPALVQVPLSSHPPGQKPGVPFSLQPKATRQVLSIPASESRPLPALPDP